MSGTMSLMSAPHFINWNIDYSCNFACNHCYSRASHYPDEPDREKLEAIAQAIAASGVFEVALGGGEPLMVRPLVDIISILAEAGIYVALTTNGWLLNEDRASELRVAGLSRVLVSVESADPEIHDSIRNRPNSLSRAKLAASNAASAGMETLFSSVVSRFNFRSLRPIVDLASELNLYGVQFKPFRPSGNGYLNQKSFSLSDEEIAASRASIEKIAADYPSLFVQFAGEERDGSARPCACGVTSACIRPNGDLAGCVYDSRIAGNILNDPLSALWENDPVLREMRETSDCPGAHGDAQPIWGVRTLL